MTNSLLQPSTLPFALPDYATLTDADYREAIEAGMTEQLKALQQIAEDPAPATVENVLHAWERSGLTLDRAMDAFWVARSADTTDERDAIAEEFSPRMAQHADAILLDAGLYARLSQLRERADAGEVTLDEQDDWALTKRLRAHTRAGVALPQESQDRLRELNTQLASAENSFEQVVSKGRNAAAVHVTDEAELAGLSEDDKNALAANAQAAGVEGWLIPIVNTTTQPVLDSLENRELRERVFTASVTRGLSGEFDTRPLLLQVARLRAEKAQLLGYDNYAAYDHEDTCAGSTDAVNDLLTSLVPGVMHLAQKEADGLRARFADIAPGEQMQPWDWQHLAAQSGTGAAEDAGNTDIAATDTPPSVDPEQLKPYLEFTSVLTKGVFAAATALYGITFHERPELVGYTPDSVVYEVREEDGSVLGAVIFDPFTRPSKRGGAWMTSIAVGSELLGELPVVTNTCNVPPPAPGSPSLMTWDNVITLFHEFGHDLHGLLGQARYPSRSGTAVPRDFVEFPSQVNEIWAFEPSLIRQFAVHHETGETIPDEWIDALVAGRQATAHHLVEIIQAMILDQAWHQLGVDDLPQDPEQVEEFETAALENAGIAFALVPPRYRSTYFQHIFGGGYAAGYYSYLWSEVMDADAVAWFREQGDTENPGGMTRAAGEHFRRELLGRAGSVDAMTSYRRFRGAHPQVSHLLARFGLAG